MFGRVDGDVLIDALGDDSLLELARGVELKEVASSKRKGHAVIVGLEMVIDLGEHEGGELAFGERLVFVECLAVNVIVSMLASDLTENEWKGGEGVATATEFPGYSKS